jgi:hypothetical protein
MEAVMGDGYELMDWLIDDDGREFICKLDEISSKADEHHLTAEEKSRCLEVDQLIGANNVANPDPARSG